MRKYYGKISYTIDVDHPDRKYVKDWTEDKVLEFDDTYTFSDYYDDCDNDEFVRYIQHDLKLVAGGGYDYEHIHNVKFDIKKI